MILSHERKFVFVHIARTGGTSIASALQRAVPDAVRCNPEPTMGWHANFRELLAQRPECAGYFTFTCVRNPWERAVSLYAKLTRHGGTAPSAMLPYYRQLVEMGHCLALRQQVSYLPVDAMGRFEDLHAFYGSICNHLGIPCAVLHHEDAKRHFDYHDYYTDELLSLIRMIYRDDVKKLGYRYDF